MKTTISKLLFIDNNISNNSTIILSVSGGIDSMVLFDILKKLNFNIVVVHFNHQTRANNLIEAKLVEDYALKYNIKFHMETLNIPKGNFHNEARNQRLFYLKKYADIYETPYIFTAHHLDDLAETILMNIGKGSDISNYFGFEPLTKHDKYCFVKPLIYHSKEEIMDYANKNNIPYLNDESNDSDNYTRNRFRHHIVPILKKENSAFLKHILEFHKDQYRIYTKVKNEAEKFINESDIFIINDFLILDELIQKQVLVSLLEKSNIRVSQNKLSEIKKAIISEKPNIEVRLSNKYKFIKSYNSFYINEEKNIRNKEIILKNGKNHIENMFDITFFDTQDGNLNDYIKICYNKLAFPLKLRSKKDGDVLSFSYGHKKLSRFLIDKKIPLSERKEILILCDSNDVILWIKDLYINKTLGTESCIYFLIKEDNHA